MTLTEALAAVLCVTYHGKMPDALGGEGGYCDIARSEAAVILADPAFRKALTAALAEAMDREDPDDDENNDYTDALYWHRKAAPIVKAMLG